MRIFAFILPVVLLLIPSFSGSNAQAELIDKIAATVNHDVVLLSDVDRFYALLKLRKSLDPIFAFSSELIDSNYAKDKVLEFLIQEKLISQTYKVEDAEVEAEIKNLKVDTTQIVAFLKNEGFTYDDYFEQMRVGLQKRHLWDREIHSRVNISDDDVRNYAINTMPKTAASFEYDIQLITVRYSSFKKNATSAAYDSAKSAFNAIKKGQSFDEIAKETSDDPSAPQGGRIGSFSKDQLKAPLNNLVPNLKKGQVSELIKTTEGYLILKLVDVKSADDKRMEEQKEEVREKLARVEYKKQLYLWAERAKNAAYINKNPI